MTGASKSEKKLFTDQANKDWEIILLNRSKELIKGGRFVCINFGIDGQGRCLGNTGGHIMFNNFSKNWRCQFGFYQELKCVCFRPLHKS